MLVKGRINCDARVKMLVIGLGLTGKLTRFFKHWQ